MQMSLKRFLVSLLVVALLLPMFGGLALADGPVKLTAVIA
jgi:hypothetical protein